MIGHASKRMKPSNVVIALFAAPLFCGIVHGLPNMAGSCAAGTGAILTPGLSHATHAQVGGTALADYGLHIMLNGELLSPDTPVSFDAGASQSLELMAGDASFKGFLIRIADAANSVDTISVLTPVSGDDTVQVSTICTGTYFVGGLTHTDNSNKTSAAGVLLLDEGASDLILDVTVVIQNSDTLNISQWYYSNFTLNAIAPTSAPTPTPPVAPTAPVSTPSTSSPGESEPSTPVPAPAPTSAASSVKSLTVVIMGILGITSALT